MSTRGQSSSDDNYNTCFPGGVRRKLNTSIIRGDNNLVVVSYVVPQVDIVQ